MCNLFLLLSLLYYKKAKSRCDSSLEYGFVHVLCNDCVFHLQPQFTRPCHRRPAELQEEELVTVTTPPDHVQLQQTNTHVFIINPCCRTVWPGGLMVRAFKLQLRSCGFSPQTFRFRVTTVGKLFACMCLSSCSIIWKHSGGGRRGPAAGKITVGLDYGAGSHGEVCTCVHD